MGSGQSLLSVFSPSMDLPSSDQEKMGRKEKRKRTDKLKKDKKKQRTAKDGNLVESTEESVDGACKIHEAMKLLMSVVDVNSRPEDLIRLKTDGTPEMEINEPLCVEYLHKIHDHIVELKQKSIKKKRKRNWSELPIELLESILLKLVPSEFDVLGFRHIRNFKVICRSWRAAAKSCSSYVPLPRTPCLLFHENITSMLFDPIGKKPHKIRNVCDFFLHARIVGSSYGWIVMFYDDDDSLESKGHLFNPITRASIPIPGEETTLLHNEHYKLVTQAIISSNPSCTKNFVVVLEYKERQFQYGGSGRLAYYKHGHEDVSWKTLDYDESYDNLVDSFVFHDDHLVASTWKFTMIWNFKEYPPSQRSIIEEFEDSYYLMESLTGEILRLRKSYEGRDWYKDKYITKYETLEFSVEKLNLAEDKWEKLQNLKDQSIFFFEEFWSRKCRWQLMSVPNSCFLGCEKNSIYYGTSEVDEYVRYDLEKSKMETVMESDSEKCVMKVFSEDLRCYGCRDPLLWIVPNPW